MSRNGIMIYCAMCLVCISFYSIADTESFAQGYQQSQPSGSTQFLAVPTEPVTVPQAAVDNSAPMNYPQTNPTPIPTPTGSAIVPESMQAGANVGGGYYRSIPPSALSLEPEKPTYFEEAWNWQFLPDGVLYQSYLAGGREPRLASELVHEKNEGMLWDVALGARVGVLRYGTVNSPWPEGWELDVEGAAFPRLNLDHDRDVEAIEFRGGAPLTVRRGPWEGKFGYYHLSSHLGDEYMVRNVTFDRANYVRDAFILGAGYFLNPDLRLYSEAGWAFHTDGGSEPWEFQFGVDYSPAEPTPCFSYAAPFFAINGRIRQEVDYGGNLTVQTGFQWRGHSGHLARIGMQYFNGMSDFYQFLHKFEEQIGLGVWYDF